MGNTHSNGTRSINEGEFWEHPLHEGHHFHYLTVDSIGIGMLLAAVGGFLDAYTYISRNGVFATAQTGNLVLLGVKLTTGHLRDGLLHIPPIVAFVAGVAVSIGFKRPRFIRLFPHPVHAVLLLEMVVLAVIGFLPASVPNMFVTIAIAFVSSIQISTFRKLIKWPFNSTMVTGNLRTAVEAGYLAFLNRDRESSKKSLNFSFIILSFFAGALIGTVSTQIIGVKAILICSGFLLIAMIMINPDEAK